MATLQQNKNKENKMCNLCKGQQNRQKTFNCNINRSEVKRVALNEKNNRSRDKKKRKKKKRVLETG